jgi:lauroyl/myristoyl acyltransferase
VERQGTLREDISRITQDIAHALEDLIRIDPTQWHLMSPNWPSDHVALAEAGLS